MIYLSDEQMINISAEVKDNKESQDASENKENIDVFNISKNISNNNSLTTKHDSKEKIKYKKSYYLTDSGINIFVVVFLLF